MTSAAGDDDEGADAVEAAASPQPQVVRVKRELLAACMTCPLCNKLLNEATTISECLHTFCRKCIFEKLTDEEVDCCPICNIDLGCVPIEKLRPDHTLQDVRANIFPLKRRNVEPADAVSPITFPVRRKERSLSSLVVNTPRRSLTGRRTRATARKASALRKLSPIVGDSVKKENNIDDYAESSSSPDLSKMTNRRQNSSNAEASNHSNNKDTENNGDSFSNKGDPWRPLNCLVEAANRTKTFKPPHHSPVIKSEQINGPNKDIHTRKSKVEKPHKSKIQKEKNFRIPMSPSTIKPKRLNRISRKRKELRASAQALVDAVAGSKRERTSPIWLSLISSFDEKGDPPLPQIDTPYLRIIDGDLPVSFIQRYLVKKLNLASEVEVEIKCGRQTLIPTLAIHSLLDLWLQPQASKRLQASVGASAKDFVMVLTYSCKAPNR